MPQDQTNDTSDGPPRPNGPISVSGALEQEPSESTSEPAKRPLTEALSGMLLLVLFIGGAAAYPWIHAYFERIEEAKKQRELCGMIEFKPVYGYTDPAGSNQCAATVRLPLPDGWRIIYGRHPEYECTVYDADEEPAFDVFVFPTSFLMAGVNTGLSREAQIRSFIDWRRKQRAAGKTLVGGLVPKGPEQQVENLEPVAGARGSIFAEKITRGKGSSFYSCPEGASQRRVFGPNVTYRFVMVGDGAFLMVHFKMPTGDADVQWSTVCECIRNCEIGPP